MERETMQEKNKTFAACGAVECLHMNWPKLEQFTIKMQYK